MLSTARIDRLTSLRDTLARQTGEMWQEVQATSDRALAVGLAYWARKDERTLTRWVASEELEWLEPVVGDTTKVFRARIAAMRTHILGLTDHDIAGLSEDAAATLIAAAKRLAHA